MNTALNDINWHAQCLYKPCQKNYTPIRWQQDYCSKRCAKLAMPPEKRKRKLTPAQINEIRRRYRPRPVIKELAREFHVSTGLISRIVNNKTWKKRPTIEELRREANDRFFGKAL